MEFEPRILGFLCNWCSYAGADLAGVSRIQYPPNVRVIRVMCSGRVDPIFVFEALKIGIDGVIIMGCHPGDCHYISGNYEAEMKFDTIKKLLNQVGLADRVYLEWVSAAEGVRFGEVITNFTEKIQKLGKIPIKEKNLLLDLNAMENAVSESRLRAFIGRKRKITEEGNVYEEKIPLDDFEDKQDKAIFDEYIRQKIQILLKTKSNSVKELAKELNVDSSDVLAHIVVLKDRNLITMDRVDGYTPYYVSIGEGI